MFKQLGSNNMLT